MQALRRGHPVTREDLCVQEPASPCSSRWLARGRSRRPPAPAPPRTPPVPIATRQATFAATSRPSGESFKTVETATLGQLYRGVTFTPGTDVSSDQYGS